MLMLKVKSKYFFGASAKNQPLIEPDARHFAHLMRKQLPPAKTYGEIYRPPVEGLGVRRGDGEKR
jgi:hypothetical protein